MKLFTRSLARELAPDPIRVNSIAPGAIQTPINRDARDTPSALQRLLTRIPYGATRQPEDIGKTAAALTSDYGAYIHGQTIVIDGGMTLHPEFASGG
jgi:glucose 1-dehydrogenase